MVKDKDSLGNRMKQYEAQYASQKLLNLTPVICRVDGRSFHNFTNGLKRPFDRDFHDLMVETTKCLLQETCAVIAYTQSDEISLVLYQSSTEKELYFDNRMVKMVSMIASLATAVFNKNLPKYLPSKIDSLPLFDCRVFNVPTKQEAALYLHWREWDAYKNAVSMAAQSMFLYSELMNKNTEQKQEMMFQKHGINFNDYPTCQKRGTYLRKEKEIVSVSADDIDKLPPKHHLRQNPDLLVERYVIQSLEMPPIRKVLNKVEVIFDGEAPKVIEQ